MHTYFVDVPSVLLNKERNAAEGTVDKQELKIEFIMDTEDWEFTRKTGVHKNLVQGLKLCIIELFQHCLLDSGDKFIFHSHSP